MGKQYKIFTREKVKLVHKYMALDMYCQTAFQNIYADLHVPCPTSRRIIKTQSLLIQSGEMISLALICNSINNETDYLPWLINHCYFPCGKHCSCLSIFFYVEFWHLLPTICLQISLNSIINLRLLIVFLV